MYVSLTWLVKLVVSDALTTCPVLTQHFPSHPLRYASAYCDDDASMWGNWWMYRWKQIFEVVKENESESIIIFTTVVCQRQLKNGTPGGGDNTLIIK